MKRLLVAGILMLACSPSMAEEVSPEELVTRQCPQYHKDLMTMTFLSRDMDGGIFVSDRIDKRIEQCKQMNKMLTQFDVIIDNLKLCRKNGAVGIVPVIVSMAQTDSQMRELLKQGCE